MRRSSWTNTLVLVTAILVGGGPYVVRAAAGAFQGGGVANADVQSLFDQSDAKKAADEKVKEFGTTLFKRFEETARMKYLTVDELSEYSAAINAEAPTPMQTQRITAIKKASTDRAEEYSRLLGKPDAQVTAADRARLRELNTMEQARPEALQRLSQIYQRNVDAEEAKLKRLALAEVRQAIAKVAKENGVAEVFDSAALVAAPLDLTPLVLPKVRKAKP